MPCSNIRMCCALFSGSRPRDGKLTQKSCHNLIQGMLTGSEHFFLKPAAQDYCDRISTPSSSLLWPRHFAGPISPPFLCIRCSRMRICPLQRHSHRHESFLLILSFMG